MVADHLDRGKARAVALGASLAMPLTYELLLDLYRGKSTAVEQIADPAHLAALAIDTPVTALLRELDAAVEPRHVVLTGSAGDGKTFAAITASTRTFQVITDASARRADVMAPPIEDLAAQIATVIANGRLLLAINRGQLERLYERVRNTGGELERFVTAARRRTVIQGAWDAPEYSVAVADLGYLDRLGAVTSIANKIGEVPDDPRLSNETRAAFAISRGALAEPRVMEWITGVVRAATGAGANVTMRQLWSFMSFLVTGARPPLDRAPLTVADAVGARLFSASADGALFDVARERCDPATAPNAQLTREILLGTLRTKIDGSPLGVLARAEQGWDGKVLARVAAVHGIGSGHRPSIPADAYRDVAEQLLSRPPGWHQLNQYPRALVRGVYRALGLWHSAEVLPAWQTLCFDSSQVADAAVVADSLLSPSSFRLASPRPPPEIARHVTGAWTPPFLWLGGEGQPRLRLTPRVFRALLSMGSERLETEELYALDAWLRSVAASRRRTAPDDGGGKLRVARRGANACLVLEDSLTPSKTAVSMEGAGAIGGQP